MEYLKPIQEKIMRYLSSPEYLNAILIQGNQKAQDIASATWEEVQYKLGLKCILNNESRIKINK